MARLEYNYKFLLDGVQIPIIVGDEFGYKYEKEQDAYYFRKKLNNEI